MPTPFSPKTAPVLLLAALSLSATTAFPPVRADTPCGGALLDIMLVIDVSGSMGGEKIQAAREGAFEIARGLSTSDQSGLVAFASFASLRAPLGHDHAATSTAILALTAGGSTAMGDGVALGRNDLLARTQPGARKVMVVLTDGYTNAGVDPGPEAEAARTAGIELFTVGIGTSVNEPLLRSMASSPENYYHPLDAAELLESLRAIARELGGAAAYAHAFTATVAAGGSSVRVPHQSSASSFSRTHNGTLLVGESESAPIAIPVGPLLVQVGVSEQDVAVNESTVSGRATATSRVSELEVVGLFRLRGVVAVANALAYAGNATGNGTGTGVASLEVAGAGGVVPIPGTTIPIPGGTLEVLVTTSTPQGPGPARAETSGVRARVALSNGTVVDLTIAYAYASATCGAPLPATPRDEAGLLRARTPLGESVIPPEDIPGAPSNVSLPFDPLSSGDAPPGWREREVAREGVSLNLSGGSDPVEMEVGRLEGRQNGSSYDVTLTLGEHRRPTISVFTAGAPLPPVDQPLRVSVPAGAASAGRADLSVEVQYRHDPSRLRCALAVNGGCFQYAPVDPGEAVDFAAGEGARAGLWIRVSVGTGFGSVDETVFVPFVGQLAGAIAG